MIAVASTDRQLYDALAGSRFRVKLPNKMKGLLMFAIAALAHSFAPAPGPRRATTVVGASPLDNLLGFIKGGKIGTTLEKL